jgi:hypothetical protein
MGRRPPVFDLPSASLSRVASALRDALKVAWPFARKAEKPAAEPVPARRIHFETFEPRLLLSGDVLPAASTLLHENEPDNNALLTATVMPLTEDPVGSGLAIGRAEGRQDPATSGDYWSDPDWWRLELQKGDVISVSVDTPASDMDPYLWLGDGSGSGITSDDNSGPGNDAAISHYTVTATGVYYIQVGRYGPSTTPGAYELHVERTRGIQQESDAGYGNDSLGGANPLTLANGDGHRTATVAGTLMAAESSDIDEDVYNLGIFNAGNVIELSTRLPGDGTLSPMVVLLDAAGAVITDTDGNAIDGHAKAILSTDGVIYARVESNAGSGSRGQYLLDVDISDPVPPRVTGVTGLPAAATEVALNVGALPSTQGWRYVTNGYPETSRFSTDGSTLRQNSVGLGGSYGYYQQDNVVDASRPFELALRARQLQEERVSGSDHNGFGFAVFTGTYYVNLSFSATGVQISGATTTTVALDTTVFHDYVLSGDPSGSYGLSVDGTVIARGDLAKSSGASYVWFGDATSGPNAEAELTQLSLKQPEAHDLVGPTLELSFSEALDPSTVLGTPGVWHYGGHTYTLTPRSMIWSEAEAEAQRLGGHLVTINDEAEQAWVSETFGGWGGWNFWLGMNRQASGMAWASGEAVSYTNWGPGQPSYWTNTYLSAHDARWYNTDNTGLGNDGWGVIEIADAGADGDADGLPDRLDPYPANPANAFDLREAGADASFDTADDVRYTLRQTAFSGTGVSLRINEGTLGAGNYRFSATPTLRDPAGNALDGNGDGSAGDAYQRYFSVTPPAGYQIEHSGAGPQAPLLELTEDPAGSGLAIGRALGRLDPAYGSSYSDMDAWRIELEKDDRVSISVDSPASTLYPSMWLYDPAGSNVASDGGYANSGQGYGPDYDTFISNYQVKSTGTYVLLVAKNYYGGETRGAYELHVERARGIQQEYDLGYANDSIGGANTLTLAVSGTHRTATVAGTLMAAEGSNTDEDVYNLGLFNAGNVIELSTRLPGDGTLLPKVTLLDAAGAVITDTDGNAVDGHAQAILSTDGVIYARVESNSGSGSRGQYLLDVDLSDPVPPRVTGVTGLPAAATEIALNVGALPSMQGWRYISNGYPETSLFSTDGSTLRQNGIGLGGYYGYYQQDNIVDASRPFELALRARQLQEERVSGSDHNGFGFAVFTGTHYVNLSFSATGVQISGATTSTVALDTTVFHDYVLSGDPSGSYGLSVDGTVIARGDLAKSSGASYVWFGDATSGPNAEAELTQLSLKQPEAHDLVGPTLELSFSEALDPSTVLGTPGVWHYGGHTYTLTPRSMIWSEAEAEAQRLGGHLVTINDEAEQAWVSETFGGWGGWNFWLGMNRQASGMAWASGEAVSYTNWGPGEPSGYGYSYLTWNGKWYNTSDNGLGSGGWGVIEIDDAGADGDADGLPDRLDPYPANAANAFDLREAGADASFGTADDVLYTLRQTAFNGTGVSLRINEGTLGAGNYRFSATPTLQDPAGNALDGNGDGSGGDAYERFFTIAPPVGYQIEHSGFGPQAPLLELTEDPAGSGLAIGRALGRLDPAYGSSYSDMDAWRIELEKDDRVSISVDSPASTLYPSMWLYDPAGSNVAYDEGYATSGYGYGPDYDTFISNYQVKSNGTYVLLVAKNYHGGETRGAYELHVERARGIQQEYDLSYTNDSIGGANTLTLAVSGTHRTATVAGTIMAAEGSNTDEDVYNLGLFNAGNVVELSTRLPGDGTLLPKVTLLDASGQVIADTDGNAVDGHAKAILSKDGVIFARVESNSGSGSRGQYLLDVDLSDPVPPRVTGVTGLPAAATEIALNVGALPSTQGWRYISNGYPETSLFSTDGSTLRQNGIGLGGYYGYYQQDNIVDASRPFELALRARQLQEERVSGSDHNGFGFAVFTGTHYVNLSFSATGVQISGATTTTVALDTTVFHDYVLSGDPSGSYGLSVDGTVIARGDLAKSSGASYVWFGDATSGPNAEAGLTQLSLKQPEAHDLVGPTLELSFSEALDASTVLGTPGVWHYGGHTYTLTPRSMIWSEAEAEAQRLGGHLVTINDEAEQAWVSETFGGWGGWYFWLGMNRQASGMAWASGEAVSYTNWGPGEPSGYGYSYLTWNGKWYNTSDNGLGSGGWGVIEIDDAGADGDADGLPDRLDPYPANAANAFDLREAGADASFGTADDVLYTLRQTAFNGTGVSLRINEGTVGAGNYRFSATPTLQDPAGNALDGNGDGSGGDTYERFFTIAPPVGYQIEHSGFGPQAPLLELTEDPAGSGLAIGRALGRLDPAYSSDYSDLDVWRIELEKGDRVSISVDTPAGELYPAMWLYDAAWDSVASDDGWYYGYGPDSDTFISNYQATSSGTYTLVVSKNYYGDEYRGAYELHVERARGIQQETDLGYANDSIGGANPLTLSVSGTHRTATVAGTLMAAEGSNTDEDVYNLGLFNAGNVIELSTRLPGDGTLSPKVVLLDAAGAVITDTDGNAVDGHAKAILSKDGVIYARVESNSGSGSRGQYLLDVDLSDPVPPRVIGVIGLRVAMELALDCGVLPSTQGWSYISSYDDTEASIFSVDGGSLHQNSMSRGDWDDWGGWDGRYSYYQRDNVVDASRPFDLSVRVRLLQEDGSGGGFAFAVHTGSEFVSLAFGRDGIQISGATTTTVALDTTVFHDYVLSGDPSGDYSLSVDGTVVARGDLSTSSGASYLWFGDATGGQMPRPS